MKKRMCLLLVLFAVFVCNTIVAGNNIKKVYFSHPLHAKTKDVTTLFDGKIKKRASFSGMLIFGLSQSKTKENKFTLFVNLVKPTYIQRFKLHLVESKDWGVVLPVNAVVSASTDGTSWDKIASKKIQGSKNNTNDFWVNIKFPTDKYYAVVKVDLDVVSPKGKPIIFIAADELQIVGKQAENIKAVKIKKFVNNLIPNGGFEINNVLNIPDFWTYWSHSQKYLYSDTHDIYSDKKMKYAGKHSLCIDSTRYTNNFHADYPRIRQYDVKVQKIGSSHTLSFYAKSNKTGVKVKAFLGRDSKTFNLSEKWKKCTISSILKSAIVNVQIEPVKISSNTYKPGEKIWVDNVQLETGDKANSYSESLISINALIRSETAVSVPELNASPLPKNINMNDNLSQIFKALRSEQPVIEKLHSIGSATLSKNKTLTYLCYDKSNLYLFVRSFFPDSRKLKSKAKKHDGAVYMDDAIELFLQPNDKIDEYFHLAINSKGTVFDARRFFGDKKSQLINWTAPFKYKASAEKNNWMLKITIPLKWLNNFTKEGNLRFNITRGSTSWAPVKKSFHEPAMFGIINGLDFLKKKSKISFKKLKVAFNSKLLKNELLIPLVNNTSKPISCELKLKITRINSWLDGDKKKDKASGKTYTKQIKVSLKANEHNTLKEILPSNYNFWKLVDIFAIENSTNIGNISNYIIESPTLAISSDEYFFNGEDVRFLLRDNLSSKNSQFNIKIIDKNNQSVFNKDIVNSKNKIYRIPGEKFNVGEYKILVTLKKNTALSVEKNIQIYEKVKSYTKIDGIYKTTNFSGKRKIIYAPYFCPVGKLAHLKDSDYNAVMYRVFPKTDFARLSKYLDDCKSYDIHVFVDTTMIMKKFSNNTDAFNTAVTKIINEVKNHPAYSGVHIIDEPRAHFMRGQGNIYTIKNLRNIVKYLKKIDPLHLYFYVNGGTVKYDWGFDTEDVVSYDRYNTVTGPKTRNFRENYYGAVIGAYQTADFFNKPMWRCLEGNEGATQNGVRSPNYDEWNVLVFSTIAAGGKGIWLWASYPSYHSLRKLYKPITKKLQSTSKYFVESFDSDKITPDFTNPEIIYKAVDYNGELVLLMVNLAYKYNSGSFSLTEKYINLENLYIDPQNDSTLKTQGNKLKFKLKPYGVILYKIHK
jgi:hypothetical protein